MKLDIEFKGDGEPKLEIEVELSGRVEDETPELAWRTRTQFEKSYRWV